MARGPAARETASRACPLLLSRVAPARQSRSSARVNVITPNSSVSRAPAREIFSVEGARVTLEANHGWQCSCSAHRADTRCSHIEQAQGLRRRRGEKREPDTIELELSAEQLRTLSEGLAAREEEPPPAAVAVPNMMRPVHRWDW